MLVTTTVTVESKIPRSHYSEGITNEEIRDKEGSITLNEFHEILGDLDEQDVKIRTTVAFVSMQKDW